MWHWNKENPLILAFNKIYVVRQYWSTQKWMYFTATLFCPSLFGFFWTFLGSFSAFVCWLCLVWQCCNLWQPKSHGYLWEKQIYGTFLLPILSIPYLTDCWGTTVDFTTSFLHSSRFSAFRSMLFHSRPVHSLVLSSPRFLCLPLRLPPWPVPCRTVSVSPDDRVTCPYHFSLCLFTEVRTFLHLKHNSCTSDHLQSSTFALD